MNKPIKVSMMKKEVAQPFLDKLAPYLKPPTDRSKELRNLSRIYFRTKIGDKWENVVFEDLEELEQDRVMKERSSEWLKSLAKQLANTVRELGDKFDILAG